MAKSLEKTTALNNYIAEISKIPMLTEEEERRYALLKEQGDINAAKILVKSHLKLVVKIANKYKNYGLCMSDLIAEGNLGLMKAVKDFSLSKGCRVATYAMWWIKANIQEYILRSWSLVKIGTTLDQKKLFFNLGKIKNKLLSYNNKRYLDNQDVKQIANYLNVQEKEVIEMDQRMFNSDVSINKLIASSTDGEKKELGEFLPSKEIRQDNLIDLRREKLRRIKLLQEALSILNDRERDIVQNRQLDPQGKPLKDFSQKYNISIERVRQIEEQGIKKMKQFILNKLNSENGK